MGWSPASPSPKGPSPPGERIRRARRRAPLPAQVLPSAVSHTHSWHSLRARSTRRAHSRDRCTPRNRSGRGVAQSAPWGLPGRAAPALRLGPGQPARGGARGRSSQERQTTAGATVTSRHFLLLRAPPPQRGPPPRPPRITQIPNRRPTANPLRIISLGTPGPPPPRFSEDQADAIHWSSPEK